MGGQHAMTISGAFDELMNIRGGAQKPDVRFSGKDPVYSSHYRIAETGAAVLGAVGVAVSDIWELKTGRRQSVSIDARHAAAALNSFAYLERRQDDGTFVVMGNSPKADQAYAITQPWPTKDGRWFLPHFGIAHLKAKVLDVLKCKAEPQSVADAVVRWDGEALENAIAEAGACGGMVRSHDEWLAHPHGQAMAARPVVEIQKIGHSDPEPFPSEGPTLHGIRELDLTRILAGPVAARTCAEHGADVLMVAAKHLPQIKNFIIDLSHGKRRTFQDLDETQDAKTLRELVRSADVFSQGYRPGVLEARGFGAEELAQLRPGIIHVTLSCFGSDGPLRHRAGWEQVAQCMVGIAHDSGHPRPTLLPVPACDYLTGYLGAYGILLALALRAKHGGSYTVNVSLCQSGMFLDRQGRVRYRGDHLDLSDDERRDLQITSESTYGVIRHLAPVIKFSETTPHWSRPTPALGGDAPVWLP